MTGTILIYGATGYTGKLIAKAASRAGARPILAGRSLEKVKRVAGPLGLAARAFDLADPAGIDAGLKDVAVVLCAAGPFSATSRPMADACLRNRAHYLDITGEIDVFEALAARDAEAKARGVMLLPGVGFDVVPSDCLAAHLKRRLPDATDLKLYLSLGANMSRGTAKTMLEFARLRHSPSSWRRDSLPRLGRIGIVRLLRKRREVHGPGQLGRCRDGVSLDRHSQYRGPFPGVAGNPLQAAPPSSCLSSRIPGIETIPSRRIS